MHSACMKRSGKPHLASRRRIDMAHQVTAQQLSRLACLYVRQSTLQQVLEHGESTARQYSLRERAVALGWPDDHIIVIDQDLGHSGASMADRLGFQRLVTGVALGLVDLVVGLEVSRLASNSSDWNRLLEICALTNTLILVEDGLYDPATFNDRLLLGLKGTMSEAELYVIRARLQGGIMSKARRGALKLPLPIGLCYPDNQQIVLDPHLQVQATIRAVFATFTQAGSACATVRQFRQQQISFPHRLHGGGHRGELAWGTLQHHDVLRLLHHPGYAGAYVFGRTRTAKTVDGKVHIHEVPREEWLVVRYDSHVGYITWEEYERNQEQLAVNSQAYAPKRFAPPREGPALLQGLILCGRCGERMTVRYHQRGGRRIVPDYVCQRAGIAHAQPHCQRIRGAALDRAVADLVLKMVTPEAIALVLAMQQEVVQRAEEAQRLRHLQVERAQYEVDLAQRRYLRVDPDNRLVAQVLEAEWNAKLRELAEAQEAEAQFRHSDAHPVSQQERRHLGEIPERLAQFWHHPQTSARDRKRAVRLLIEDVTLQTAEQIVAHIRFKGGATQTLSVPFPPPFAQSRLTAPQTLEVMQRLLHDLTDTQTAEQLNALGYRTFTGLPFHATHVAQLRRHHRLTDRCTSLREQGWWAAAEKGTRGPITLPKTGRGGV